MEKVCIYGAGSYTKQYINGVELLFDIQYILDRDPQKLGSVLDGYEIKTPTVENVNEYPVLVLMWDYRSAFQTLDEMSSNTKRYYIEKFNGGWAVCRYNEDEPLLDVVTDIHLMINEEADFPRGRTITSDLRYDYKMGRNFNLTAYTKFDAPGGPNACLRNLYLVNEKYGLIPNFFSICPSCMVIPSGYEVGEVGESISSIKCDANDLKKILLDGRSSQTVCHQYSFYMFAIIFLRKLNDLFLFNDEDRFLIQDPDTAWIFIKLFPRFINNVVLACHMQGSLKSERQKSMPDLSEKFDLVQSELLGAIKRWVFPSWGAWEGFMSDADDRIKKATPNVDICIVHNGFDVPEGIEPDETFLEELKGLESCLVFSSASFLYANKGVERIPRVLNLIKKITGRKIKWVLVGGGEMEADVESAIEKYLVPEDYIWYRQRFDNQHNVFALFQKSDFYIMMHKVSVFDLSTLQAMAFECIPLLSDVGGNKEFCAFDNGFLVNPEICDAEMEKELLSIDFSDPSIGRLGSLNKDVVSEKFSDRQFLEGYANELKR